MTIPQATDPNIWPKTYILSLYTDAITHGCVRVSPVTPIQAKSLTQSFYRFRRRVDTNTSTFIQPEFQLVSVSNYSPDHGGCIYIIFNALPEGAALPTVTPVLPDELSSILPEPICPSNLPPDLVLDTEAIDPADFVRSLREEAAKNG